VRPVSSHDLAAELALRLDRVTPEGFTVTSEESMVAVRYLGEFIGAIGTASNLETIEGLKAPIDAMETAARSILSGVQDYIADISTEPWPGHRSMPMPAVVLRNKGLEMWFGEEDEPVLVLPSLGLPAV
jgi:hypothetical protein